MASNPARSVIPFARLRKTANGFEPVAYGFLDMAALPPLPPDAVSLGLDGVKRIELQWGFQDDALMTMLRVVAPAPRRGLLASGRPAHLRSQVASPHSRGAVGVRRLLDRSWQDLRSDRRSEQAGQPGQRTERRGRRERVPRTSSALTCATICSSTWDRSSRSTLRPRSLPSGQPDGGGHDRLHGTDAVDLRSGMKPPSPSNWTCSSRGSTRFWPSGRRGGGRRPAVPQEGRGTHRVCAGIPAGFAARWAARNVLSHDRAGQGATDPERHVGRAPRRL